MSPDTPARGTAAHSPCVFAVALLARRADCGLAEVQAHAESQKVVCSQPEAHANCRTLYALLRAKSVFALKLRRPNEPISHALAMKLECGGLQGLQQALEITGATPNVRELLLAAQARVTRLEDLPFERIVGSVVHWQGRRPAKRQANPGEEP